MQRSAEERFFPKPRKPAPYEFVLDAISVLEPRTRPMFGCLAVYVGEKIVLILRDKRPPHPDNGVWLATTREHHESLRREFPSMRSIRVVGKDVTGWQVLHGDFLGRQGPFPLLRDSNPGLRYGLRGHPSQEP